MTRPLTTAELKEAIPNKQFRCSRLSHLITEPKTNAQKEAGEISETAKTYVREWLVGIKYGRKKDISNKYTKKGIEVEDEAITLYTDHRNVPTEFVEKNETFYRNEDICGTPDMVLKALIPDVKSKWDLFTFVQSKIEPLNKDYYWQLHGYMWLTGIKKAELVSCLINTPDHLIQDAKYFKARELGFLTVSDDSFDRLWDLEFNNNYIFDDIPKEDRIHITKIEYDESSITLLKQKIKNARRYATEIAHLI